MRKSKYIKGQELVEFALILPVMIVILVVISELGFAWVLKGNVADSVKSAVQQMQTIAGQNTATATNTLQTNIKNYLISHNIPNANSLTVNLSDPTASDYTTVAVNYTYNPIFTLPNFFGIQVLPTSITMNSYQIINSAILRANNFATGDSTVPVFATPSSVLVSDSASGNFTRNQVAFLIDLPGNVDVLVNWWGHSILPAGVGINALTGKILVRSPYTVDINGIALPAPNANGWRATDESYAGLLLVNGYTTVYYIDATTIGTNIDTIELGGPPNIWDGDLGIGLTWCKPKTAGSGDTCDGDLTSNTAKTSTMVQSIYNIGNGFEVLTPIPTASNVDQVTLPSSADVADNTRREIVYNGQNFAKLKFYVPKSAYNKTFITPSAGVYNLANAVDRILMLKQTVDADGDGLPTFWDLNPDDPDIDKDMILDGYAKTSKASVSSYPISGWTITNNAGTITYKAKIPTKNVTISAVTGFPLYATPTDTTVPSGGQSDATLYASSTCAASSCTTVQPFFLKALQNYKTANNYSVKIPKEFSSLSADALAEKYYNEPDITRAIVVVRIMARDFNKDGKIQIPGADANAGKYDATAAVDYRQTTTSGPYVEGLVSFEPSNGGKTFTRTDYQTLGRTPVNPATDLTSTQIPALNPSRKGVISIP